MKKNYDFLISGDYYMVAHNSDLGKTLKTNCGVQGIPMLCVVDKDGKIKHAGGRADVTSKTAAEVVAEWKKK